MFEVLGIFMDKVFSPSQPVQGQETPRPAFSPTPWKEGVRRQHTGPGELTYTSWASMQPYFDLHINSLQTAQ